MLRRNLPGIDVMFVLYTQIDDTEMTQILKDAVAAEPLPTYMVSSRIARRHVLNDVKQVAAIYPASLWES